MFNQASTPPPLFLPETVRVTRLARTSGDSAPSARKPLPLTDPGKSLLRQFYWNWVPWPKAANS